MKAWEKAVIFVGILGLLAVISGFASAILGLRHISGY
jgi:hypothetical protein